MNEYHLTIFIGDRFMIVFRYKRETNLKIYTIIGTAKSTEPIVKSEVKALYLLITTNKNLFNYRL